jgi:CO/xanthine dehydrogenase Mo-binding subunit
MTSKDLDNRQPEWLGGSARAQEAGPGFREHELPTEVSAWVHIGEDGRVTVFTGKVEIGQSIGTSLAQLVAEELRVSVGIPVRSRAQRQSQLIPHRNTRSRKPRLENA